MSADNNRTFRNLTQSVAGITCGALRGGSTCDLLTLLQTMTLNLIRCCSGQTLDLQFARNATADRPLTAPSSDLYRVRPGDSLSQIAHRFKLDTADLLRWNGLTNNDLIYPGQELIISPR